MRWRTQGEKNFSRQQGKGKTTFHQRSGQTLSYIYKNNNSVIIAMTREIKSARKYVSGHWNSLRVVREDFLEEVIFFKAETQN